MPFGAELIGAEKFMAHVQGAIKSANDAVYLGVNAAAHVTTKALRATGNAYHITGRGGRRIKLRAHYDIKRQGFLGADSYAIVSAGNGGSRYSTVGPWVLVEHGSYLKPNGYDIVPRVGGRTRKARAQHKAMFAGTEGAFVGARPLRTPYGPRYRVHHPPVKPWGKPWEAGVHIGQRLAPPAFAEAYEKAITKGMVSAISAVS